MIDKLLLQNMQFTVLGQPFHSRYFATFSLHTQHQTGADQAAIQGDTTGTAITGTTAFFYAGKANSVAQRCHQALVGGTGELDWVAVNRR
jgi:hypothetical protein